MTITKFFAISYRNLARNGRRTALTALAVALGLVVVMAFSALLKGIFDAMLIDNINMSTGILLCGEIRRVSIFFSLAVYWGFFLSAF